MKALFLLGAGFSIPAGFPSSNVFNQQFFNSVENKILMFSSSEWAWDEHGEAASHNGRLNFEFLRFSYLLSELVEQFQKETFGKFDYESFYDWFLIKWNNISFMQKCCDIVNSRLKGKVKENSQHFFQKATINEYSNIDKCYNHLIADLLNRQYSRENSLSKYKGFVKTIKEYESVDIFTLNHDVLLEFILKKHGLSYSDGFSEVNSCIVGSEGNLLPVFDINNYNEPIKLMKLHGSVDFFKFNEANQINNYYGQTGKYWFFKPGTFDDKHLAKRIDLTTGNIVQDFNHEITPQFLTGKSKSHAIDSHQIFKPLFENLKKSISTVDKIFVIGYSYSDNHINEILKNAVDKYMFELINVNPSIEFPFRKDYKRDFIKQISSIEEL